MASLNTSFPSLVFLHSIDVLEWRRSGVETRFSVELKVENRVVFSTWLYFAKDADVVRLDGVSDLLLPYLYDDDGELPVEWSLLSVSTNGIVQSCRVIPSLIDLGDDALGYVRGHFLSALRGCKQTPVGCRERIYAYSPEDVGLSLEVSCLWDVSGDRVLTEEPVVGVSLDGGVVWSHDLCPGDFSSPSLLAELVSYTVRLGDRLQSFEVVRGVDAPVTTFSFVGSFGVVDRFHCFGLRTVTYKQVRGVAHFSTGRRVYDVKSTPEIEVHTGELSRAVEVHLEDLLNSRFVSVDGRAVVIDSSDFKSGSSPYSENVATITYSSSVGGRLHGGVGVRLFDGMFDKSFE